MTRAVAVIKQQLLDRAGIELYVENEQSALWPMLPAFPVIESDAPGVPEFRRANLQTSGVRLAQ